jgi:hypothetical protein
MEFNRREIVGWRSTPTFYHQAGPQTWGDSRIRCGTSRLMIFILPAYNGPMSRKLDWDHETVYDALVAQGLEVRKTDDSYYVRLYPQTHNCAILYKSGSKFSAHPLHLQPASESWAPTDFRQIFAAIASVKLERDVDKLDGQQQWIHCTVDWARLARAFALKFPEISE